MLTQCDSAVLDAVGRASRRSARVVREELKDGVYDLATIASIAPWIGILGTVVGIVSAFEGTYGNRGTAIAARFHGLSIAMCFTALGLMVGLLAMWCYKHLSASLAALDGEMQNASLDLLNQIGRFPGRFVVGAALTEAVELPTFGDASPHQVQREERFFRRCCFIAGAAVVLHWFVQAIRFFWNDSFALQSAAFSACFYLPFMLAVCYVLVYPFWSRFLHQRPGGLVALASVLCLCWSVAELVLAKPIPY